MPLLDDPDDDPPGEAGIAGCATDGLDLGAAGLGI